MTEWFSLFRGILQEELKRRRGHDHKYSLRRFAKDLGLSAGATSDILNGRIHISNKRAALLLTKIPLPVERRDQMRALMGLPIPRATVQISEQNSFVLTDWIYLAVLHFFDLESSDKSPAQIARRLARKTEDVEEAIEKLIKADFLHRSSTGEIVKNDVHWASSDGPPSAVVARHHVENLRVAELAVAKVPPARRDFTTITFCGTETQLAVARAEIREVHKRISAVMEATHPRQDVYRLSICLFPMNFEDAP